MKRIVTVLSIAATLAGLAGAQSIRPNAGFNSRSVPRNDDGSSNLEPLGFTINFFGKIRTAAFVNNNGNLTFDSSLATFTPFGLQKTAREIIAPFFADVDTRPAGSRLVTFGQDTVNGRPAFGANYINVGYYNVHADKLNSFQVVLVDRSDTGAGNFDIEFNYAQIRWETGDASGGVNGFGGTPAAVGWSNGTADFSFELPGSLIAGQFLDGGPHALVRQTITGAANTSSSSTTTGGTQGRLVFRSRDGIISPGLQISNGVQLSDATVGAQYAAQLTATGSKGPFRWSLVPDVATAPGLSFTSAGVLSGVPTTAGTYSFTLSVTAPTEDGDVTVYQRGSLTVRPPALSVQTSCPLDDGVVGRPYSVTFRAAGATTGLRWSVDDPYSMPPGVGLSAAGQFAGTPVEPGTYVMNFRVSGDAAAGIQPAQKLCRMNVAPAAVRLASGCALKATVSVPYSQILLADGGFGPYRINLLGQLPFGLALTDDGFLAGTPIAAGAYPFQLAVTDSQGRQTTQNCSIAVDDAAFTVSACPLPAATTGTPYTAHLPAAYTWSVSTGSLPAGLNLTPDGTISGTPMTAGPARFGLVATDSTRHQVGQACSLAVNRGALSISGCPLPDAGVGDVYRSSLSALGGSAPYFFTTAGTVPNGIDVSVDGLVRGAATDAGTYGFTVLVREASGQTTQQACSLTVVRPALRIASGCPLPDASLGETYTGRIEAAGGVGPYRFDFGGYLPDGLTAAADGSVRGTPTTLGGRAFLVRATDNRGSAVTSLCSLNVNVPTIPLVRLGDIPATFPAASTTASIPVELAKAYSQPVTGQVVMTIQADARSSEADANQPDPRLRFANGQTTAPFTIAAGATRVSLPLSSTGTVASTVAVSLTGLRVAGADLPQNPSPKSFQIAAAAPTVTSACYKRTDSGIDVQIAGVSTTRELKRADVTVGAQTYKTDVTGISAGYYTSADTVRAGGAFALVLPIQVTLAPATPVPAVTLDLTNTIGSAGSRTLSACQ